MPTQPQIAAGQDADRLSADLTALLATGWALDPDQITLQKTYRFKTYTKVLVKKPFPL
ncbi:MAG: hypothetical protein Q9167_008153, partial [Letrouitia subvulpina]